MLEQGERVEYPHKVGATKFEVFVALRGLSGQDFSASTYFWPYSVLRQNTQKNRERERE